MIQYSILEGGPNSLVVAWKDITRESECGPLKITGAVSRCSVEVSGKYGRMASVHLVGSNQIGGVCTWIPLRDTAGMDLRFLSDDLRNLGAIPVQIKPVQEDACDETKVTVIINVIRR